MGTPAFMPPEQAAGVIGKVNERADVFGLGALLAVILTGKPPYVGPTPETVRAKAVLGELAECFARLDTSGAEPELVALLRYLADDWTCIDFFREAVAILKQQPDPESLELAEAESGLGVCVSFYDRKEAIELYTHALQIRRARLGEHDMQTLSTMFLLAYAHLDLGDHLRGLALVGELLKGLEQSPADPLLAKNLRKATSAIQMEILGVRADAIIPIWQDVVRQLTKVAGDSHFLTAFAKRKTAMLIYSSAASELSFQEAARLFEEGMGTGPLWMRNLNRMDLARTLMRMKRDAEAEPLLVQVVAQFRKAPPQIFAGYEPHALQLLAWIAERSNDPRKQATTEGLIEQALAAARANPHTPPGRTALALRDVAIYRLSKRQDGVTTAPLFAESGRLFARALSPTDLRVAEALAYQSLALRMQGKAKEADALRQQAAALERRHARDQSQIARNVRQLLKGEIPPWP